MWKGDGKMETEEIKEIKKEIAKSERNVGKIKDASGRDYHRMKIRALKKVLKRLEKEQLITRKMIGAILVITAITMSTIQTLDAWLINYPMSIAGSFLYSGLGAMIYKSMVKGEKLFQ